MIKLSFARPLVILIGFNITGCTVHPSGEHKERQAALNMGKSYEKQSEAREIPSLPENPSADDLVQYALLNNADLEQQYWQWRAAIEQITIDGTQPTNLAISVGTTLNKGAFAANRTILTAENDPMTGIAFPGKLSAAAQRSLENARAAGWRFRKMQYALRQKVLNAYYDYAFNAEMIRLADENIGLLETASATTESRYQSGLGSQQDVLRAEDAVDLAMNDVASVRSQLLVQRAALNALLNRPPSVEIAVPVTLPAARPVSNSDQQVLDLAARANPELLALADEVRAKQEDIHLAELQYFPDFDLAASTDLKGITQSLLGIFTVPIFRYEALHAAVIQAQANLNGQEAMRRQSIHDLSAQLVDDLATLRDADRQLELLQNTILTRAHQAVDLARIAYQTGSESLLDLLDTQRASIDIERLIANLQVMRNKRLAEIEALDAIDLDVTTTRPTTAP